MKATSAFIVFVPKNKPLSREFNRGLKAPYEGKNVDGVLHMYERFAHPRALEQDKLVVVGYWCEKEIDDCKVLLATGKKRLFSWFNSRYKTLPLTRAWKDPSIRLKLKQGGVQATGEGTGRPVMPKTVCGVDLDQMDWTC